MKVRPEMIGRAICIALSVCVITSCGKQEIKTSEGSPSPVQQKSVGESAAEVVLTTACDLATKVAYSDSKVNLAETRCDETASGVFEITGQDGQSYRVEANEITVPVIFMPGEDNLSPASIYNSDQDYWSKFGALFRVVVPEGEVFCLSLNHISVDGTKNSVFVERERDEAPSVFSLPVDETGQAVNTPLNTRKYTFMPGSSYFAVFSREPDTGIRSVDFRSCR